MFLMGLLCLAVTYDAFSQQCFSMSYDRNGNRIGFKQVNCTQEWRGCENVIVEQEETEGDIQVYPNPNDGRFSVEIDEEENASSDVCIYDSKGALIYSREYDGKIDVDISDCPSGIYLLRIVRGGSKRSVYVVKL